MEEVRMEPMIVMKLQYRRAEGEPLIDCGEVTIGEENNV